MGIMKSQGPGNKNGAGKHDAALDELRTLKEALSRAGSAVEVTLLLSKFNNIANGLPDGVLPTDLENSAIEAVYVSALTRIADPRQPISEQDLKSGEKSAERDMKGLIFINDELKKFLEREDIKATTKRNKAWAQNPNAMSEQDVRLYAETHNKEKAEVKNLVNGLDMAISNIEKNAKEGEAKLIKRHGSKDHAEVIKYRTQTAKHIDDTLDLVRQVQERTKDSLNIMKGNAQVQEKLGEKAVRDEEELHNGMAEYRKKLENAKLAMGIKGKTTGMEMPAAEKVTARLTSGEVQQAWNVSRGVTTGKEKSQSKGIT
jgi:hypothetical protein